MIRIGLMLVQFEAAMNVFHGHDKPDDGPHQPFPPRGWNLRHGPDRLRQQLPLEPLAQSVEVGDQFIPRHRPNRPCQMHGLIEPGRHLMRRGVPVGRHVSVIPLHREQPRLIAIRKRGANSSFTVRKISHGEGVERVFPTYSPLIAEIAVKRKGAVRRAKLYYMRERKGKAARIREKITAKAD